MQYILSETVDISRDELTPTLWPTALMVTGNNHAHLWRVTMLDNGQPLNIVGVVTAKFRRAADDATVIQSAAVDGNVISVALTQECYRYPGQLRGMLEITTGSGSAAVVSMAKVTIFTVLEGAGDQLSDPTGMIPSIGEINTRMADVAQATDDAQAAAAAADGAADDAKEQADAAKAAAAALESMTCTGTLLAAGQALAVTISKADGHYNINIAMPQGPTGVRGTVTYSGTAITGTSTTPTAYATGIAAAIAGDRYRYNGTAAANVGNEYVCTQGGDAASALWAYDCNVRGAQGNGTVNSVDSVAPDANGDVALGAVLYKLAMSLTDAYKATARANIGAQAELGAENLLPLTGGGTGAGTAADALTNLGAQAKLDSSHPLATASGGLGKTYASLAAIASDIAGSLGLKSLAYLHFQGGVASITIPAGATYASLTITYDDAFSATPIGKGVCLAGTGYPGNNGGKYASLSNAMPTATQITIAVQVGTAPTSALSIPVSWWACGTHA